jgi:hypothetical protein
MWLADVRDQDVRGGGESREHVAGRVAPEIQDDRALVAVQAQEGGALSVAFGSEVTAIVAVVRLDLDDVRAEIAEQRRPVRAGQHRGHVQNADSGQRRSRGVPCGRRHPGGLPRGSIPGP